MGLWEDSGATKHQHCTVNIKLTKKGFLCKLMPFLSFFLSFFDFLKGLELINNLPSSKYE
jgi:hypothetical protein